MVRSHFVALCILILSAAAAAEKSGDVGSFFHLTDLHFDPEYLPGADPINWRCTKIVPNATRKASAVGDYECDLPTFLLEAALAFMRQTDSNPDFIINTGDNSPHYEGVVFFEPYTEEMKVQTNMLANHLIAKYFPAEETIVLPVIGNHDVFPTEFLAPPDVPSGAQMLRELASTWKRFRLPDDAFRTALKGGYYSVPIDKELRVVVLNTQYCSYWNGWMDFYRNIDVAGQLEWLNATLTNSRRIGEKVMLLAHFAPGPPIIPMSLVRPTEFTEFCEKKLNALLSEHGDIVKGAFFGHEHLDAVKVFHRMVDNVAVPLFAGYLTSSLGTWRDNNPSVRRFTYSRSTKEIIDFQLYSANLSRAIETGHVDFELVYSAKEKYGIKSLDPASWFALLNDALLDDKKLDNLREIAQLTSTVRDRCITSSCRRQMGCSMLSTTLDDYVACMAPK